jgi:glycosyltransferase involved in cell wall biosynthesis
MSGDRTILVHGPVESLTSSSLINRQLVAGLRRRGYQVTVIDADLADPAVPDMSPPDVYLFHSHPFDARTAPGTLNVFVLNYEYLSVEPSYEPLIARLNAAFDLVLVPATFLVSVLKRGGLRIPVDVVPWGVDPEAFNPSIPPVTLPTAKSTVFLHLGAVNYRKGTDLLLEAYTDEFTATDDVTLVIKEAMRHPTFDRWIERLQARYLRDDPRRPEIVWIRDDAPSVGGYYTAADVGVFPHRGEGFGLPVLECIASGRPVIVTEGTGPAAFCSTRNSWRVRARRKTVAGRRLTEADVGHLQSLLRRAFRHTQTARQDETRISRTAAGWLWERTIARLDGVLRKHFAMTSAAKRPTRSVRRAPGRTRPSSGTGVVAYAYFYKGQTSWKKVSQQVDQSLASRFPRYRSVSYTDRFDPSDVDTFVGLSEFCLERLLKLRAVSPEARVIVHQECTVLGDRVAILNAERRLCGLPQIVARPIDLWRNAEENRLADHIIVASTVARRFFLNNGFSESKVKVIHLGTQPGRFHMRTNPRTVRFLFSGTDPLRKGIRLLFEAWGRARLPNAELLCIVDLEVLRSPLLLKHLVAHQNIIVRRMGSHADFFATYQQIDCLVLPSLEDSFSLVVGDGMGRGTPAIVSTSTGIQDLIRHGVNGYVVETGNVEQLADALIAFAENVRGRRAMCEAAYETAREYTWARFRRGVGDFITDLRSGGPS